MLRQQIEDNNRKKEKVKFSVAAHQLFLNCLTHVSKMIGDKTLLEHLLGLFPYFYHFKISLQEKREKEEVKRRELAEFMSTQGVKNGAKANTVAGQT